MEWVNFPYLINGHVGILVLADSQNLLISIKSVCSDIKTKLCLKFLDCEWTGEKYIISCSISDLSRIHDISNSFKQKDIKFYFYDRESFMWGCRSSLEYGNSDPLKGYASIKTVLFDAPQKQFGKHTKRAR